MIDSVNQLPIIVNDVVPVSKEIIKTASGSNRKEVIDVPEVITTLTRKELYDEIWKNGITKTAAKYGIPYVQFKSQLKAADIPAPTSGYWTKISCGKAVEKPPLTGNANNAITLSGFPSVRPEKADSISIEKSLIGQQSEPTVKEQCLKNSTLHNNPTSTPASPVLDKQISLEQPPTKVVQTWGATYNVYDRDQLYREVWAAPVTEVAKRYEVSDAAIHKICKSLDIPTPPVGYWAKLRSGKKTEQIPLPFREKPATKNGLQPVPPPSVMREVDTVLPSDHSDDKAVLLTIASQIKLTGENEKMHPLIVAHRKNIVTWKNEKEENYLESRARNKPTPPNLALSIGIASIPRVCRIIDSLIKATEPIGWKLTNDLEFVINGETVNISFSEAKEKIEHIPTKEENKKLLEYEDARKMHKYAYPPQIKKYDYVYNGDLSCSIHHKKTIRCKKGAQPEDHLSGILLELAVAAEQLHQERLDREEAERQRRAEAARKEEIQKRREAEITKTESLAKEAEDYDTACKIRAYVSAYQAAHPDDADEKWIAWASQKADWYDPTIHREDEYLGKRTPGEILKNNDYRRGNWW